MYVYSYIQNRICILYSSGPSHKHNAIHYAKTILQKNEDMWVQSVTSAVLGSHEHYGVWLS